jgi:hypothetical protein
VLILSSDTLPGLATTVDSSSSQGDTTSLPLGLGGLNQEALPANPSEIFTDVPLDAEGSGIFDASGKDSKAVSHIAGLSYNFISQIIPIDLMFFRWHQTN